MDVIVVRLRRRCGLQERVHRADDRVAGLATRARPLDEHRLDGLAHEQPLHARLGVLDERLHEQPLALDVEAEEALVALVPCEAVGADVDEAARRDRRALERRHVEEEVGVAAGAVRRV